jgi:DnaJ-class molecular chaperone
MKRCPECSGTGILDEGEEDEHRCELCGGSGAVNDDDDEGEVLNTKL